MNHLQHKMNVWFLIVIYNQNYNIKKYVLVIYYKYDFENKSMILKRYKFDAK